MKLKNIIKNNIYIVDIVDMTITGEGIGKIDGFTVFVNGAITGDVVKTKINVVKKNYCTGDLIDIIEPSKKRVEPPCEYFGKCGGCQIQNVEYSYQLKIKNKIVEDALRKIGGFKVEELNIKSIIGADKPYRYRNKGQYKVQSKGLGFYEKRSHKVIPLRDCLIQGEHTSRTIDVINKFMKKHNISIYDEEKHQGVLRGVVERVSHLSGEIMLILVLNGKEFKYEKELIKEVVEKLPKVKSIYLNFNTEKTNVVLSKENKLIYGKERILDHIGDYKFEISPLSFFQVNPIQTKILYDKVAEFANLKGTEIVFDLYCGIGTISLYISKKALKVYGIEIVPEAIEDAKENGKLNNINNVEFIQGKSEEKMPELLSKGIRPDVIIVDPPRKGCDEKLLASIIKQKPEKIIYVSCNPATLARDLKILCEDSYKIKEIQPVDMFSHTMHVECVVLMSRVGK